MLVWNTIESDAAVFTEMIEEFSVKGAQFEDLISIDEDTLKSIQPLYGLVFLFKYRSSEYEQIKKQGKPFDGEYLKGKNRDLFFARQHIQNACATHAVLSIIMNRPEIELSPVLTEFKTFLADFNPDLKGETISASPVLSLVHNSFSRPSFISVGDDKPSDENEDGLYHFIGYVPFKGQLLELDSLLPYPVTHGQCTNEEFPHKLAEVLQRRVQRGPLSEIRFDAIALTADKRKQLEEAGDLEGLEQENSKRMEWKRENILRRQNFVGLIHELVKGISKKETDENWQKMLENGRNNSKTRMEQMNAQRKKWKSG